MQVTLCSKAIGKKQLKKIRACLIGHFKQLLEHFKHTYTHFTHFFIYSISKIPKQQYSNSSTKHPLNMYRAQLLFDQLRLNRSKIEPNVS